MNKPKIEDDNPEWTDADFDRARPAAEVLPELLGTEVAEAALRRGRGQRGVQKMPTKDPVSIRLSPEVVEYFKATGKGWQTRLDDVLREYVGARR
jgi:uncharacterized protein (DUF4415 family)